MMPLGKNSRVNAYKRPRILEARPLVPDDLRALAKPRPPTDTIKFLRDKHHRVARLVAGGVPDHVVCSLVGIHYQTLYRYRHDPAFRELVARYRAESPTDQEVIDHFKLTATANMIAAEEELEERLATDRSSIPISQLLKITSDRADRFGYGKHTSQTNLHVGMAAALEARARLVTIDATACPVAPSLPGPQATSSPTGHLTAQAAPFQRRGL